MIDDPERADAIVELLLTAGRWPAANDGAGVQPLLVERLAGTGPGMAGPLKTRSELTSQVIDSIVADHPYDIPEVVAVAVGRAAGGYLEWIDAVTAEARATRGDGPPDEHERGHTRADSRRHLGSAR